MKFYHYLFVAFSIVFIGCKTASMSQNSTNQAQKFDWKGANLYFLLTDRFYNGDKNNDNLLDRTKSTGVLRNFMGGDIKGITKKVESGYFTDLGINAIWFTPIVEQIHDAVDEGTGNTYGFHGYWAKDWTALDPNFGTKADLKDLVEKAHAKGIRIVLDAVVNHTGPVTSKDPVYPSNWVRTSPKCTYNSYRNFIDCTLVENLPDVLTESNATVELPQMLVEKWKKEGRYEQEVASLDAFFKRTGYPRAPKYYIMKWLADYIIEFGIDGYRVDTVKHTTEDVWADFNNICQASFELFKKNNPRKVIDDSAFFMLGEVYGYGIHGKHIYDFGDKKVNYFENGLATLINFDFKGDANKSYEELFSSYNQVLQTEMKPYNVANYLTSHDDGHPFDKQRKRTYESATKLLLTSGISQIYYGDETARSLEIKGSEGDATLRSFMNWEELSSSKEKQDLLKHYQKLGQFRANHPSVGNGEHQMISKSPYLFTRNKAQDVVLIGLDLPKGEKTINVNSIFQENAELFDFYSKQKVKVINGKVIINSKFDIVLIEKR